MCLFILLTLSLQAKKLRLFSFWVEEQDELDSPWLRRAWARYGRGREGLNLNFVSVFSGQIVRRRFEQILTVFLNRLSRVEFILRGQPFVILR